MRMLPCVLVPLFLLACDREPAAPDVAPEFAATHTTSNTFDSPWSAYLIADLGATCLPEEVFADGFIHFLWSETITSDGNYTMTWKAHPQGLTGVGLTSGATYHFVGVTQEQFTIQGDGFPINYVGLDRLRVTGPGPDNNFFSKWNVRFTVNGIGNVVVDIFDVTIDCQ